MTKTHAELLGKIKATGHTQKTIAKAIDRDISTINQKLNGKSDFTASEIRSICGLLDIPASDIPVYFF